MKKLIFAVMAVTLLSATPTYAFDLGKCVNTINKKVQKVKGFDPRSAVQECAFSTLSKGKKFKYMEKCLVKVANRNVKHIKDPGAWVENNVGSIKKKCS